MTLSLVYFAYAVVLLINCVCVHTQDPTHEEKPNILLLRVIPRTVEQLVFLKSLMEKQEDLRMQFWRHPDHAHRHVDVWISSWSLLTFQKQLDLVDLTFEVITNDIIEEAGKPNISMNNIADYDRVYHNLDDITSEIRRLAVTHKKIMTTDIIGSSTEGRPIYSVHIHKDSSVMRPVVFVLCGVHSREWLGIAACQYVLRKLVFDHNYDEEIAELLSNYDVVMVPLANPDGYDHSKRRSRMWRKSRSKTTDRRCRGVDINRNFNYRWGGSGSSPDPCEETYCGEKPFSERETLSVARYLYKLRRKLVAFVDIHTYGQMWMSPWGFTTGFPQHYARMESAMLKIQRALYEKNSIRYKVGTSSKTLYVTSGDANDWVYGVLGIVHCYGVELRPGINPDPTFNGFVRDSDQIIGSGKDLLVGLKTLVSAMINEGNARQ